jgi:hypothetical protein
VCVGGGKKGACRVCVCVCVCVCVVVVVGSQEHVSSATDEVAWLLSSWDCQAWQAVSRAGGASMRLALATSSR